MAVRTVLIAFAMLAVSVSLRAADQPLAGTWKLNLAKTKYDGGPPPKDIVETFEPDGGGMRHTMDVVNAKGEKSHEEFAVVLDGKSHPYKGGNPNRDAVAVKRVGPSTYQVTYMKGGEANQINYWIVSKDGKTLTTHSNGVTDKGQVYHRIVVFDKQ